jgi:hypothetical protein
MKEKKIAQNYRSIFKIRPLHKHYFLSAREKCSGKQFFNSAKRLINIRVFAFPLTLAE